MKLVMMWTPQRQSLCVPAVKQRWHFTGGRNIRLFDWPANSILSMSALLSAFINSANAPPWHWFTLNYTQQLYQTTGSTHTHACTHSLTATQRALHSSALLHLQHRGTSSQYFTPKATVTIHTNSYTHNLCNKTAEARDKSNYFTPLPAEELKIFQDTVAAASLAQAWKMAAVAGRSMVWTCKAKPGKSGELPVGKSKTDPNWPAASVCFISGR